MDAITTQETTLEKLVALPDAAKHIVDKIKHRRALVSVIGLGYVGLPLAVAFAEAGFRVVGLDVDQKRVANLNAAHSYIPDIPSERLAKLTKRMTPRWLQTTHVNGNGHAQSAEVVFRAEDDHEATNKALAATNGNNKSDSSSVTGSFFASTDFDILYDVDAVIICVPTPLDTTKEPDMSFIISAVDEIARRLHPGMLVVLESTTYPGTTEELVLPRLEQAQSGARSSTSRSPFVVGRDFFLAFSPERIDPGRLDFTVQTTPKVIGGVTKPCLTVASSLYECAIRRVVPVSLPKTAEMVKLLENTFRAVNIGLINEIAIICGRLGIDVWEVIEAAKTKPFGYMTFYPGPGLGGHCIPIDPEYLAWKLKSLNYNARFIQLAAEINFGMPRYVLDKVSDALNDAGKPLKGSNVVVLGVAYKADISDLRESPALDVIHELRKKGAVVKYHDPYVPQLSMDGSSLFCAALDEELLREADCIVITTAHSSYDWSWVVKNSRLVVDTRNATHNVHTIGARIVKL